jgi:UDP-N-acetylmuramoylalanine--D-glutamate ligase
VPTETPLPDTGIAALADQRIAIWGFGREGRASLSALRRRYPQKLVDLICLPTEVEAAHALHDPSLIVIEEPVGAPTLARFDVVIKSPGISPYRAPYPEAAHVGVRFTSGTALWFAEHAKARVIAVTGTKGKSTVSALIAHLLRRHGLRVALAGNIGMPLLDLLEPAIEPDWWVIELSSFQARDFGGAPQVAVINNVYEEHLDWHETRANYVADKLAIAAHARRVVVNAAQHELSDLGDRDTRHAFNRDDGWHVRDDAIWRGAESMLPLASIALPGLHNAQNVCAALAAVEAAGIFDVRDRSPLQGRLRELAQHVATFKPLPHRLQRLGCRDGIDYINDSISTTPYAAIEALRSVDARATTILVGGFDRGLDWRPFVDYVAASPPSAIVTMGANGPRIAEALCTIASAGFELIAAPDMERAFDAARAVTREGGTMLLSPGAPSFDQFHDYAERGREFARLAGFDPAAISEIEGLGIA